MEKTYCKMLHNGEENKSLDLVSTTQDWQFGFNWKEDLMISLKVLFFTADCALYTYELYAIPLSKWLELDY